MKSMFIPLHGSFVQTRDGDLDGSQKWMFPEGAPKRQIFRDLAEALTDLGVGSFRYDKRASGESGGDYVETDLLMLARDANIVFEEMRRRFPDIKLGIIGQSEGSLVALKAYELGMRPDYFVLQGPLLDPIEPFLGFQRTHAAAPFLNDKSGALGARFPYLKAFYEAAYIGDLLDKIKTTNDDYYELRLGNWKHKTSLRKYRQYGWSGYELLKKVNVPTLLVVGSEDANVSPDAVKKVRTAQSQGESFVDAMGKPLSPRYLGLMRDYFNQQTVHSALKSLE